MMKLWYLWLAAGRCTQSRRRIEHTGYECPYLLRFFDNNHIVTHSMFLLSCRVRHLRYRVQYCGMEVSWCLTRFRRSYLKLRQGFILPALPHLVALMRQFLNVERMYSGASLRNDSNEPAS